MAGKLSNPRKGKGDDKSHPPIHPIKAGSNLQGNEAKIYEFVARHFLACCSQDALVCYWKEFYFYFDISIHFEGKRNISRNQDWRRKISLYWTYDRGEKLFGYLPLLEMEC